MYYIANDVIINDEISNTIVNALGSHYVDNVSTWSTSDVYLRNNNKFTSNVDVVINFEKNISAETYNNVTRAIQMVALGGVEDFPAGTIASLYEDGKLYKYVTGAGEREVKLSSLKDSTNESVSYLEVTNVTSAATKTSENAITGICTYEYSENFRIMVDFSSATFSTLLPKGPYNFMMVFKDNGTAFSDMDDRAVNVIRIEQARVYTKVLNLDRTYYEPDQVITATSSIQGNTDVIDDEIYGNGLYGVLSLKNSNGEVVELPKGIVFKLDGNEAPNTRANFKYMVLNEFTKNAFSKANTITIDMSDILETHRLEDGTYTLTIEYYAENETGALVEKVTEVSADFEIRRFHAGAFYLKNNVDNSIVTLSSSKPSATFTLYYTGNLSNPYVDVTLYKQVGDNLYNKVSNSITSNRINSLADSQAVTLNHSSALGSGVYKLEFVLKNGNDTQKATEDLVFNVN